MRRSAFAAILALLAAIGTAVPVAAAVPSSSAKVVIIVGATEGTTSTYRSYADAAYAEAIKYTSHVTKVYSPNATWAKVKAAAAGANILLYYGHGNGWPSPYTYDPNYTTKDGFGLNDPTNLTDSVHKYYGEPSVATLGLAPNAIVLLGNLCYASGNSEPGGTAPTVSVARQRIDNYAAGFIRGGARAVIADGHGGLVSYIRGLFTTSQTIVGLWRTVPDFHNHVASFASTRSSGYTAYSDTDTTTGGYYRSLVTKPTITTNAVTNATGDTGTDPATLVVPGRAEVATTPAPLYATTSDLAGDARAGDLPVGTRLKVVSVAAPATLSEPALIQVQGLNDASISGLIPANVLRPRDSAAPVVLGAESSLGRLSPNGDGRVDTFSVSVLFSESLDWTMSIRAADGTVVAAQAGSGREADVTWDGLDAGIAVADGTYTWTIAGTDAWENGTASRSGTVVVDTTDPAITGMTPTADATTQFSPNGDGTVDTTATTLTVSEAGFAIVRVVDAGGTTIRSWSVAVSQGPTTIAWDGRTTSGAVAADGDYELSFQPRDLVGNDGEAVTRPVRVMTTLGFVAASSRLFYPQDKDRLAPTTTLSFRLARPATVIWTLRNAAGGIVATRLSDVPLAAGMQSWVFNGRLPDGTMLPGGVYQSYVTATDASGSISQSRPFEMNAFGISTSTTTAIRGGRLTVSATSAEPLSTGVRLYMTQPGVATYAVTMTKVSSTAYRATFTVHSGATGTLSLKVWARDLDGRSQATYRSLTLR